MPPAPAQAPSPFVSPAAILEGMRLTIPMLPGVIVFAAAVGTLAQQKGLSLAETLLMSAIVYAGLSQTVALEAWPDAWSWGAAVTVVALTATVNARLLLMSAALKPSFAALPQAGVWPGLFFTTDASYIFAARAQAEAAAPQRAMGIFLGSGFVLWAVWVIATAPGHMLGALVADPRRYGLDFVMPAFFIAMLVPLWRGPRNAAPWAIAGAVALAVQQLVPGWWFILAGSLAGSLAGGFLHGKR